MTTATPDVPVPRARRQISALMRMEFLALRRDRTAAAISVITPLVIGIVMASGYEGGDSSGIDRMVGVLGLVVVLVVHHHVITVYASRRQELVLKRLRAGLPSDGVILVGSAATTITVFMAQAVILIAYGVLALGLPFPENPPLVLAALALAAGVMAAFSAALSAVTRSSEAAMLTSLPTVGLFLATPGVLVPLGDYPPAVEAVGQFLPLGPFAEVVRGGWMGGDLLEMLGWLGVLAAWLIVAAMLGRAVFRWEPRRT
jgi:ABC-2 type transport system permease protein